MHVEHLIDQLAHARREAARPEMVGVQPITIRRETRMSVFLHPTSSVTFPAMRLGARGRLRFGCGLKEACWDRVRSAFVFRALLEANGHVETLFSQTLDVRTRAKDRAWVDVEIDLARFAGQSVTLTLATAVDAGGPADYGWTGWSDPVLEFEPIETAVRPRRAYTGGQRHLVLITSDALRADYLGCYGHPRVTTPHIDALAADGALFVHGRTQTPATLAAYASLLTAQHPARHGITLEWGRMSPQLASLPGLLEAQGYHTVIAASEAEVCEDQRGVVSLFRENIRCLASPAQAGEITCRQFVRWLADRPDRPFLVWLQFFDTHPPATPPEPFRSMYYAGDPADPARVHRPEAVRRVRGVESAEDFSWAMEHLPQGLISSSFVARLQDTADNLTGRIDYGPDLAAHLRGLPADARRGLSLPAFGEWLGAQTAQLRQGVASHELLAWLQQVQPMLLAVEREILSWLDGVTDFRYPLAQYQGEVSYLDHQIGEVVAALRREGLYDQTTIIVTSPHGELLGERDLHFHHHALMEEAIRIPVILKPGVADVPRGVRIEGICDLIDVAPTALDALGAPQAADLTGRSRWAQVVSGEPIEPHDSFCLDFGGVMASLTRPPWIFLKALSATFVSSDWRWPTGRTALYRLQTPMDYTHDQTRDFPQVARELGDRLDAWLAGA